MGAWAVPFLVAALLLVVAGALKLRDPTMTVGALRRAHVPASPGAVRIGGALEVAVGIAAIATGGTVAAALVALSYLLFTIFVVGALVRHLPIGSCGCFGRADTPPSLVHVVLNVGAIITAIAVALGPGGGIGELFDDDVWFGVLVLVLVALGTALAYLAYAGIPKRAAVRTSDPRANGS